MADIAPVAANVRESSNTVTNRVQFGETVTHGQVVYPVTTAGVTKYHLADNSTAVLAAAAGFVMTPNVTDGYGSISIDGEIELGVTFTVAAEYMVSSTGGAMHPKADLQTGEFYTRLGYAKTAALFVIDIAASGIAAP